MMCSKEKSFFKIERARCAFGLILTATQWLWTYNNERPNMVIGGITPAMKLEQATNLNCLLLTPSKLGRITHS